MSNSERVRAMLYLPLLNRVIGMERGKELKPLSMY
jgi:hypothetical protein